MLRYFPFPSTFDLKMGTALLKDGYCVERDEHYDHEISLKRSLLAENHAYYFRAAADTQQAQWEVVEKVLADLVRFNPENFSWRQSGDQRIWENKLLNERQDFIQGDSKTLPLEPLDWVGRQVQEDLIIMGADLTLIAGQLCFPSGWSLDDKFGKYFLDIHAPLPGLMSPMIQAGNKLLERLPAHAPVQRNNWGFRISDQLDLSSRRSETYGNQLRKISPELTVDNIGDKIFLRVEHQTLSRLPASGCILFTIHTYHNKLREVASDQNRARILHSFLQTVPQELLDYKLMTPFAPTLIQYLSARTLSEANVPE